MALLSGIPSWLAWVIVQREDKPKNCSWFKTPFLPNNCKMLAEEKSMGSACSEGPLRSFTSQPEAKAEAFCCYTYVSPPEPLQTGARGVKNARYN